jgi:hypothetical protein
MRARKLGGAVSDYLRRNALACVALFFALSGGVAWATHPGGANTISSEDIINEEVRTADLAPLSVTGGKLAVDSVGSGRVTDESLRGVDILGDSLTGSDIAESTLGQVPSAAFASNASSLGGVPAGLYYDGCDAGTVHGFAHINASSIFSATYTTVGVQLPFNCAGGTVEARRVDEGTYRVRFNGNGSKLALGVVDSGSDGAIGVDNFLSIDNVADGGEAFEVSIVDDGGSEQDVNFTLMVF